MTLQGPNDIAEILETIQKDSRVLLIQLPGNDDHYKNQLLQANLHVCAATLQCLLELPEAMFTEKLMEADVILFTRTKKGTELLTNATRKALEQCLGRTGARLIESFLDEAQGPLGHSKLIQRLSETMGASAALIQRAAAKSLYHELRSNLGELKDD
ncbi:MAG: hypothetical protein NWE89_10800 [Candidatus Bathyarchaeota archaeon]|nr:hypothetical protein [Candidatus Bathyarchaeota archaeon]